MRLLEPLSKAEDLQPHDLRLVAMDARNKHQTTDEDLTALNAPTLDDQDHTTQTTPPNTEWLSEPPRPHDIGTAESTCPYT